MKFRKTLIAFMLVVLAGCSQGEKAVEKISILVPQGATALATLSVYGSEIADVNAVAGTDIITAELAKTDSNYDVIIAPINLGAKLIEKGGCNYRLDSILTWGNLYLVGTSVYQEGDEFAAFGEMAVPGLIWKSSGLVGNPVFYNSVQDAQTQLLLGKVQAALLAEPAATASIAKAKEKGIELAVLKDMQEVYQSKNNTESLGYPQAAIFVKEGSEKKSETALQEIATFVNKTVIEKKTEIAPLIEKVGVDVLGIPNAQVVEKAWERLNIKVVKASEVDKEVEEFLKLFQITYSSDMLVK